MTIGNEDMLSICELDKETFRTLASFPREKQAFVKGVILGLRNQTELTTQQARSSA